MEKGIGRTLCVRVIDLQLVELIIKWKTHHGGQLSCFIFYLFDCYVDFELMTEL